MDDKTEPPVLADMMALKINGPTLVFLRARRHLPQEALQAINEHIVRARSHGPLALFEQVKFIVLPCDFDIMVMGDVDLERAGLTRLAASEAA
jgi:hypothetical protein